MTAPPDSTLADPQKIIADLRDQLSLAQRHLEERTAERDAALAREAAATQVLQVINSSPGDLVPVFEAMVDKAISLCDAVSGTLWTYDGERFIPVAVSGRSHLAEPFRQHDPTGAAPDTPGGRLLGGEQVVHIVDAREDPAYQARPRYREMVDIENCRTGVSVGLRRDATLLGMITVYRQEVRPFTDKQIALLQNFAAQAVIAMENARLLTETREALDQQTATAEVLGVINSSPGDLTPVFDAMLEKAMRLCEAAHGSIRTYDGDVFHEAARSGEADVVEQMREIGPIRPGPNSLVGPLLGGERVIHITDAAAESYRFDLPNRERIRIAGARTWLAVALCKDTELLGFINVYRRDVRPFTDKQIALLQNFAAQAVVAMENARLLTETREALEQQTATAQVLEVINASPGDLTPVWDAMLAKAVKLCEAETAHLIRYDGTAFSRAASLGVSPEFDKLLPLNTPLPHAITRDSVPYRLLKTRSVIHVPDMREDESYRLRAPAETAAVEQHGARTVLFVPLLRESEVIGCFVMHRLVVRPFSAKQIALVESFAAQAVIAMENARLLGELRERTDDLTESLEYQTATSDVLKVISRSTFELQPVLDSLIETAARLCGAERGLIATRDDEVYRVASHFAASPALAAELRNLIIVPERGTVSGRTLLERRVIHIENVQVDPEYRLQRIWTASELPSAHTVLGVPLLREGEPIGALVLARGQVAPFEDRQIELVRTFADQAVIALENARLITETREALEQQTATAEVLGVINSSPGDLAPVFDAMLDKAMRLSESVYGHLLTYDGEFFDRVAVRGEPRMIERQSLRRRAEAGITLKRILGGEAVVQIADVMDTDAYRAGNLAARVLVEEGGCRSLLTVALRKEEVLLGTLSVYRRGVRPYLDQEVALLRNFAAQAVIAMENARLITETREALDQQTATAEVLGVINSSPGDLAPVFDTMLDKALSLCGAAFGELRTYDGDRFSLAATRGTPAAYAQYYAQYDTGRYGPGTGPALLLQGEAVVHIPDLMASEPYRRGDPDRRALVDLGGARAYVLVGLRTDREIRGFILVYRKEPGPFTDKQIALLQNFAAQGVIAMDNARLITETREALERQTATSEVLEVINASPGDLAPVFEVMVERAVHLCEADEAAVRTFDGELLHLATTHGTDSSALERLRVLGPTSLTGLYEPFARGDDVVHYVDARDTDAYRTHETGRQRIDARGIRSWLAVALRKEGALLGIINVHRREVRPFSEKQIALLQNFAAQAVIAIDNARLLDEIRQRQQELRVTFDNMADGVAMFDAALQLTAWNKNFQELLELSAAYLAEHHTFDEYIGYLADRGEFGQTDAEAQIARLRARVGEHYSFERSRPDGTVLEVRHNPMPDGGFVLIYGDITERKRSEEEIRAARDAAEAAYRDLQAAQANLVQAQKMAALGQLTAGIAHEIKNPLNFVNNFASLSSELLDELKEDVAPALGSLSGKKREEIEETIEVLTGNLDKIVEHGQRADNIVKSMLEHSRGVSGERREVDLNGVIEEALNLAYHGARAQDQDFNITLERNYEPTLKPIEVAPQEMTRVFLNLFGNGFYAANKRVRDNGEGSFRPILTVSTRENGDAVEVRVRDNGTGIAPEIRDKLFQPFFTTKPTGEGTGLGLSISYDIITQQHGGAIEVASEEGAYTEFTIRLPRR